MHTCIPEQGETNGAICSSADLHAAVPVKESRKAPVLNSDRIDGTQQ